MDFYFSAAAILTVAATVAFIIDRNAPARTRADEGDDLD